MEIQMHERTSYEIENRALLDARLNAEAENRAKQNAILQEIEALEGLNALLEQVENYVHAPVALYNTDRALNRYGLSLERDEKRNTFVVNGDVDAARRIAAPSLFADTKEE
jgi:hypothetical protein